MITLFLYLLYFLASKITNVYIGFTICRHDTYVVNVRRKHGLFPILWLNPDTFDFFYCVKMWVV